MASRSYQSLEPFQTRLFRSNLWHYRKEAKVRLRLFLTTFRVAGCNDPLPVSWVLRPKSLSFFQITWVFSKRGLSFEVFCDFLNFEEGNLFKIYQILHFFGALRANIGSFEIHGSKFTTGSLSFLGQIRNSYRFVKFWPKKGLDLLGFFSLSFCKSGQKKPDLNGLFNDSPVYPSLVS